MIVDLERGGGDLPAIVSSAPFAIVPATVGDDEIAPAPGTRSGAAGTRSTASKRTRGS